MLKDDFEGFSTLFSATIIYYGNLVEEIIKGDLPLFSARYRHVDRYSTIWSTIYGCAHLDDLGTRKIWVYVLNVCFLESVGISCIESIYRLTNKNLDILFLKENKKFFSILIVLLFIVETKYTLLICQQELYQFSLARMLKL